MVNRKIYIFGNPLIKEDKIPRLLIKKLTEKLPSFHFVFTDPNENFPPSDEKELIILDTVLGIEKPMIFDLDDFGKRKKTPLSPHDYDLLLHLLLLKKMKKINSVKIIGLPMVKNKRKKILTKDIISLILKLT